MSDIEYPAQPTRPSLSPAAVADYTRLVNDPKYQLENPERHAALKASLDAAASVTGRSFAPPKPATSSPADYHARQHGVTAHRAAEYVVPAESPISAGDLAALKLEPTLGRVIAEDMAANKSPDPALVANQLAGMGMNYADALVNTQALLNSAGAKVKATDLPSRSLVFLHQWARHQARYLATRPK
jgi:hypothetical protein